MTELSNEEFENDKNYAFKFIRVCENVKHFDVIENKSGGEIFTTFCPYMAINLPMGDEITDNIKYREEHD